VKCRSARRLQAREAARRHGLASVAAPLAQLLSLALEAHLAGLLQRAFALERQRADAARRLPGMAAASDTRRQARACVCRPVCADPRFILRPGEECKMADCDLCGFPGAKLRVKVRWERERRRATRRRSRPVFDMQSCARQVLMIERREREKGEAVEAAEQDELLRAAANKKKADDDVRERAAKASAPPLGAPARLAAGLLYTPAGALHVLFVPVDQATAWCGCGQELSRCGGSAATRAAAPGARRLPRVRAR